MARNKITGIWVTGLAVLFALYGVKCSSSDEVKPEDENATIEEASADEIPDAGTDIVNPEGGDVGTPPADQPAEAGFDNMDSPPMPPMEEPPASTVDVAQSAVDPGAEVAPPAAMDLTPHKKKKRKAHNPESFMGTTEVQAASEPPPPVEPPPPQEQPVYENPPPVAEQPPQDAEQAQESEEEQLPIWKRLPLQYVAGGLAALALLSFVIRRVRTAREA